MESPITDEAVEAACRSMHPTWDVAMTPGDHQWYDKQMRAALEAALPHMSGVRVKPLEWEAADEGMCTKWRAAALGGHYELVDFGKDDPGFAVNFHWGRPLSFWFIQGEPDGWGPTGPKIFPTLEEAKSAAQADYERRIRSALSSPAPEAALPDRGKMLKPKPGAPAGGYGGAEELEVVATDRHDRELVDANAAEAIIEKLRADIEGINKVRQETLDALDAALLKNEKLRTENARLQIYAAWNFPKDIQELTVELEAAEARIHELEQMVNDAEADHQDTAMRFHEAESRLAEAVRLLVRLGTWIEDEVNAELPFITEAEDDAYRTFLQSLGKEG